VRGPFTSTSSSGRNCSTIDFAPVLLRVKQETGASKEFSTSFTDMYNAAVDDWTCIPARKTMSRTLASRHPDVVAKFGGREAVASSLGESA